MSFIQTPLKWRFQCTSTSITCREQQSIFFLSVVKNIYSLHCLFGRVVSWSQRAHRAAARSSKRKRRTSICSSNMATRFNSLNKLLCMFTLMACIHFCCVFLFNMCRDQDIDWLSKKNFFLTFDNNNYY